MHLHKFLTTPDTRGHNKMSQDSVIAVNNVAWQYYVVLAKNDTYTTVFCWLVHQLVYDVDKNVKPKIQI